MVFVSNVVQTGDKLSWVRETGEEQPVTDDA